LTSTLVDLLTPWPLKVLIDNVIGQDQLPPFLRAMQDLSRYQLALAASAAGFGLVLMNVMLNYLITFIVGATEQRVGADIRASVFRRLQDLSLPFHDRNRTGDLVTRLTDDVAAVRNVIVAWFDTVVPEALALVGILVVTLLIDSTLTVVALSVVPLLIYYAFAKRPKIRAAERLARDRRGELATQATDALRNVRLIQTFSRQGAETERFRRQLDRTADAAITSLDVSARYSPISSIVLALGTALVSWVGAMQVVEGRLSLGTLIVFMSYLGGVYGPIRSLSRLVSTFAQGAASRDRLLETFDDAYVVQDHPEAISAPSGPVRLVLHDVSFCYQAGTPVLRGLDLVVEPGETLCVVGTSGVGKSTLLALLLRLYEPTSGLIELGGVDMQRLTMISLRETISLVPQDPWIMDGTIRENIALGQASATGAELRYAARNALVDEFALRLPQGYDTPVGEAGILLSGGQRRRIALARALIRDAPVLLLDEPTAGLDPSSTSEVMDALRSVSAGRTVVLVSHDLKLARGATRIAVMENGSIVEVGTHASLLSQRGRYASMWMLQQGLARYRVPQMISTN
jgi:ABC-type multidrug transport system fused ATPase/permease subunit